jgi:hypothetical protein
LPHISHLAQIVMNQETLTNVHYSVELEVLSREKRMNTRITRQDESTEREEREPQPIGEILSELLTQYQTRFPELRIAIVETPAVAV